MSQVKLILTESIHSLGEAGDLVSVKPGFARNFLIPQRKAILATASRVSELEHNKRRVAEKAALALEDLNAAKAKLDSVTIEVSARAGEEGKLFGSVTTAQIAERLGEQGFAIDRRRIDLREPIKEVGEHRVPVKLHREIHASIKLIVRADGTPTPEEIRAADDFNDPDDRADRSRRRRDDDDDDDDDAESNAD
jgi:large subunit ribosomal protein L9